MNDVQTTTRIENLLDSNEKILWQGKPELLPYMFHSYILIFVGIPFLGFALMLTFIAMLSIVGIFMSFFGIPFILIGASMVFSPLLYYFTFPNIEYAITNKRIIMSGGLIGKDFKIIDHDKLQNITVNVSFIDKLFDKNTGSIKFYSGEVVATKNGYTSHYDTFISVKDPYEVFKFVKRVSTDIKTDIEYPNKLRPDINPGYNTDYKPKEHK